MSGWSRNHRAHKTTWTTLRLLEQSSKAFPNSGGIKISQLGFWNNGDSADMRATKAMSLAAQLGNVFREIRGAQFEEGFNKAKANKSRADVLKNGDKTLFDLAEVADDCYLFWGENDDL